MVRRAGAGAPRAGPSTWHCARRPHAACRRYLRCRSRHNQTQSADQTTGELVALAVPSVGVRTVGGKRKPHAPDYGMVIVCGPLGTRVPVARSVNEVAYFGMAWTANRKAVFPITVLMTKRRVDPSQSYLSCQHSPDRKAVRSRLHQLRRRPLDLELDFFLVIPSFVLDVVGGSGRN